MRKKLQILSLGLVASLLFASFGFAQQRMEFPPKKVAGLQLTAVEQSTPITFNPTKDGEGEWIHWDDGALASGVGYNGPGEFAVASRWEPADLAAYDGLYITKISFAPREAQATYSLRIWTGADHDQQYAQDVAEVTLNEYNEVELTTPFQIDASAELMFGYYIVTEAGYPAGADAGPAVGGKGDMLYDLDDGWVAMAADYGINRNWCLQAYVEEGGQEPETFVVTFNVDVTDLEGFNPATEKIYLTGSMVGWAEPGNEGSIEMELVNGSKNPPFNFADSFESYDDFVINPEPWITWSQYDVQNYGMSGVTFPNSTVPYVMLIMNPNETDPPIVDTHPAQDGDKYAIVTVKTGSPTLDNKWVITPELSFNETSQLNFWGRSITDAYGLERIRVMVSTSGSDPDDFTKISEGDYMEVPVDWTEYTYSLSAFAGETGHVAINYVSNDSFIFMLDNFKVTAEEDTPEDLIYTATLNLEAGEYQYKYFRNETWAHGEWDGDPNRVVVVEGDMEVNDIFGDPGLSDKALITEFSFDEGQDDVTIDGFEILVHVAVGTDITSLTPSITISEGATINYEYPTAMNFTNPVEFVVTAEDGVTTNTYKVTVKPTGVEENLLANLSVYPNPFGNQISVRNAEGVNRVIITNLIGQVVMDTPLTSETINTSKLSNGVYMVIFQGRNGERVVRKMVKN
ncbi:MAG TPA: choice-of-anchor J domain-containing protein [Tenuifilaceae bacterium]|nr:choice-of-anchor J domain-containing protein [Tenuifilaceae bacterium]HQC66241.1 choice-of-anchor J domain-containing protein [Tenuifilaceae bacterium]